MKKYAGLLILCALGCHSGGTTNPAFPARKGTLNILSVDPALILPDPTLGCQDGFSTTETSELTYTQVIDGKQGSYSLKSVLFYSEDHSKTGKNSVSVLKTSNILVSPDQMTATQNISCSDLHEITSGSESNVERFPMEIARADGTIEKDVSLSFYVVKGKRNPTNKVFPAKILQMGVLYFDLKNFISASEPRRHREVEMTTDNDQDLQILITDKIVNDTGSTSIHKVLATYTYSGP